MKDRSKRMIGAAALLCIVVFFVMITRDPTPEQGQPETLQEEAGAASEAGTGDDPANRAQEETGDSPDGETSSAEETAEGPGEESDAAPGSGTDEDPSTQTREETGDTPDGETSSTEGQQSSSDEGQEEAPDTPSGGTGNTGATGSTQPSEPVLPDLRDEPEETEEPESITFPYTIPNTGIELQKLDSFDGIFLEDGSDSSVSGIFTAVVKNNGGKDVEYARITLDCDGTSLLFELSDLPAGATVVVQEANKTSYRSGNCQNCVIDLAETDGLEQSEGIISVREEENGSLTVSNLTGQLIPGVRIFYKFYMAEEDVYVGGITYTAKLTNLEAGGSQIIMPSHYSKGYSKVVMVRVYDTTD